MQKWHAEGIPLPIVIEAIDQVFENNETSGRRKVISSLSYCRHAVKELWAERKELYVGSEATVPEESAQASLSTLANSIDRSAAPPRIAAIYADRVRALGNERSIPKVEQQLMLIEHDLLDAALATLEEGERERLLQDVKESLREATGLDPGILARTEDAAMRRLLRERFEVPRLTLFR
jgi:hypothetical protein